MMHPERDVQTTLRSRTIECGPEGADVLRVVWSRLPVLPAHTRDSFSAAMVCISESTGSGITVAGS